MKKLFKKISILVLSFGICLYFISCGRKTDLPLANKKIVGIGTSVMYGSNAMESYLSVAQKKLGFWMCNRSTPGIAIQCSSDYKCYGYGSLCLTKSEYKSENIHIPLAPLIYQPGQNSNNYYKTWENVFTSDISDADCYIMANLPNNDNFDCSLIDIFNFNSFKYNDGSTLEEHRDTFDGAFIYLLSKLYAINNNANVVLVIDSEFSYEIGIKSYMKFSEILNIKLIDLWHQIDRNGLNSGDLYIDEENDHHPSFLAQTLMGELLISELMQLQ